MNPYGYSNQHSLFTVNRTDGLFTHGVYISTGHDTNFSELDRDRDQAKISYDFVVYVFTSYYLLWLFQHINDNLALHPYFELQGRLGNVTV